MTTPNLATADRETIRTPLTMARRIARFEDAGTLLASSSSRGPDGRIAIPEAVYDYLETVLLEERAIGCPDCGQPGGKHAAGCPIQDGNPRRDA